MQTPVDLLRTLALFTTLPADSQAEIKDGKWQLSARSPRRISRDDFSFLHQEIEFGSQARNAAADEAGLSNEKE